MWCPENIITEHMEGIESGDRLQDHGTGQRSFCFRASPRGVKSEDLLVMESQNMSSKLVKRSHLRSPYTPPISLRYRHETTGGQGTEQSIDKRTGLSQAPPQPTPNLATYRH